MAGYIGKSQGVTQVDGYTRDEADAEYVNDPNSVITIENNDVYIGAFGGGLWNETSDSVKGVRLTDEGAVIAARNDRTAALLLNHTSGYSASAEIVTFLSDGSPKGGIDVSTTVGTQYRTGTTTSDIYLSQAGLKGGDGRYDVLADYYKIYESYSATIDGTARTFFSGADLSTATYLVRIYIDRNGTQEYWSTSWSGILTWYDSGTNSSDVSELHLQGAGHSFNGNQIKARVKQNYAPGSNEFQIWDSSGSVNTNKQVSIYVKRLG